MSSTARTERTATYRSADGLELFYRDFGDPAAKGTPVVCLPGLTRNSRDFVKLATRLSADRRVICPDLRGHGDSAWSPEGHYALDAHVYDFAQLIHALDYEKVTLIGHSLGGNICSRFSGLYPEKVIKFVNIEGLGMSPETQARMSPRGSPERLRQWIEDKRKAAGRVPKRYPSLEAAYSRMKAENGHLSDDQARHLTVHGAIRNEDGTFSWKFDNYLNVWSANDMPLPELEKLWHAITCPTLMLWGLKSFLPSPSTDGRIEHFRTARLVEYENAGHWLHHDEFDRFMADVKAFI